MGQAVGRTLMLFAFAALALAGCAEAESEPSIAELVFETLGPQSCELMPAELDGPRLRAITAENPGAPVARGTLSGGLEGEFFGGGVYGADAEGGLIVGVQGAMVAAPDDAVSFLCLLVVALGPASPDGTEGEIVPQAEMDSAAEGSFIAPYQIWDRDEAGVPQRLAIGTAASGAAQFTRNEVGQLSGTINVELVNPWGKGAELPPISAALTLPSAENIISPVPRLARDETQEITE